MYGGYIHDTDEPEPEPDTRCIDFQARWDRLANDIRFGDAQPCTLSTSPADTIGAPCLTCGHTNMVHPSRWNPALRSCAICQITAK